MTQNMEKISNKIITFEEYCNWLEGFKGASIPPDLFRYTRFCNEGLTMGGDPQKIIPLLTKAGLAPYKTQEETRRGERVIVSFYRRPPLEGYYAHAIYPDRENFKGNDEEGRLIMFENDPQAMMKQMRMEEPTGPFYYDFHIDAFLSKCSVNDQSALEEIRQKGFNAGFIANHTLVAQTSYSETNILSEREVFLSLLKGIHQENIPAYHSPRTMLLINRPKSLENQ